jgi:ABC-type transport system substrate-binding protein
LIKPRYFETVDIRTVRDENSRSMQIASGDVDIVESVRTFQGQWLRKQPGVETTIGPAPHVLLLYLNTKAPILRDVRVRKAISLAIDRKRLLDTVYGKEGELLNGLIPTGVPGHDPSIPVSRYDPDAARALLTEAGIKAGTKLTITAVTDSGNPSTTTLAIQDFLSKIGLNIEIRQISSSARSQLVAGDFDMSVQSLSIDFPDPWLMFNFAFNSASIGATNYAQYANAELDKLTMQADQREGTAREAMYQEAQRMVLADVPVVPLLQMFGSYAKRKDVQNPNYNFAMPVIHDFKTMYRTSN